MTRLLVSSGRGPGECRMAVRHILDRMMQERSDLSVVEQGDKQGPASAIVTVQGKDDGDFAVRWVGTIQWTCKSPLRPKHKRQNWFVGVFALSDAPACVALDPTEVRFAMFRAGGPGGQHQNTTDSAIRATHIPTGVSTIARDQRSQHRNKQVALGRLRDQLAGLEELAAAEAKKDTNRNHTELERGNPVRRFKGERFVEVKR